MVRGEGENPPIYVGTCTKYVRPFFDKWFCGELFQSANELYKVIV